MNRKDSLVCALLAPINPASPIIMGIYTLLWGLWVANPFWTVFGQAHLYRIMETVAPEFFWGVLAIVCGVAICYGAVKRSYGAIIFGSTVGAWHWLMIATFYFLGDIYNTGGITSLFIGVYSAYIYLNVKVNHKKNKTMQEILHCEDA